MVLSQRWLSLSTTSTRIDTLVKHTRTRSTGLVHRYGSRNTTTTCSNRITIRHSHNTTSSKRITSNIKNATAADAATDAATGNTGTISATMNNTLWAAMIFNTALVTLFAQGISDLLRYRKHFGNAPAPKSPSHGVIVAHSHCDSPEHGNKNGDGNENRNGNGNHKNTNYTFKAFNPYRKRMTLSSLRELLTIRSSSQKQQEGQEEQTPLRLLLIGDSIARGVGQTQHSNPVLPQAMGKYLSQKLNSRPVYWTTMAKPGASTKWLSQLVEYYKKKRREKSKRSKSSANEGDVHLNGNTDSTRGSGEASYSLKQFRERHLIMSAGSVEYKKKRWIENLEYHEELHAQNPFGDYDIIIVMSGLNDIKRMLVPFLLEDETVDRDDEDTDGSHDHKNEDKRNQESGFAADMKRLIELLNENMEKLESKICNSDESTETECSSLLSRQQQEHQHHQQQQLPTIVFPRFPTDTNPVKVGYILKMIVIHMTGLMDSVKGRIADQYDNVISPEAPSQQTGLDYLLQRALRVNNSADEKDGASGLVDGKEVMVNLVDMGTDDCKKIEDDMSKFYSQRNAMDFCVNSPLLKLFAPDGLHPR